MSEELLKNISIEQNRTLTENEATAFNTSTDDLVDLFALCGSLRGRPADVDLKFRKAMANDSLLATKMAFYTRDVRGGLGEREVGRRMFHVLAESYPAIMRKNLSSVAAFGRWDDVLSLFDTPVHDDVLAMIREQLDTDAGNMTAGKPISLLAKWLPSVNASSYDTRAAGRRLAGDLGMSERTYRKMLSSMRNYLNVTEVPMSARNYEYIRYDAVPSKAMNQYRRAFERNDPARFRQYMAAVDAGKSKINAAVLYPYDIVEKLSCDGRITESDTAVLEAQWKALPDYIEGENRFLIMADVSGSMTGRPMATSIGLAIYFAERNKGTFANTFMTFSSEPRLVKVKGKTLMEKISSVADVDWDMSTDLEAAFLLVLRTARKNHAPKEDMPRSIIIISDMEIDACTNIGKWGFYDGMKALFEEEGYEIPNIVFWNVNARHEVFHADAHAKGVQLASGQSVAVFRSLLTGHALTPYDYMVGVLNQPRYDGITI